MRHLKRIFESKEELDSEYLNMCFIDFIEAELCDEGFVDKHGYYSVDILYPTKFMDHTHEDLSAIKKYYEDILELYSKVEEVINKIRIEYKNIKVNYDVNYNHHDHNLNLSYDEYSLNILLSL